MTTTPALNDRQQRILDFVGRFAQKHGYAPSIRDIQDGLHISSTSVVDYNLKHLERKGRIAWDRRTTRSIRVIGTQVVYPCPTCGCDGSCRG